MSEWISVEDRLPEIDDYVLWYNPAHGGCFIEALDKDGSLQDMCGASTHWMPLPEPPQKSPAK